MRLTFIALLLAFIAPSSADGVLDEEMSFDDARSAYDSNDFTTSVDVLEQLQVTQPACAPCAHLLGKAYGRLAEKSSWGNAIGLARKSREALEYAVALDPDNAEALADLIKFYRAAPRFLGGDNAKADTLESRLTRLLAEQAS